MSKTQNKTIKVVCDSSESANALFGYLVTHNGEILRQINNAFRSAGRGMTDASFENIDKEKLRMEMTLNPTDKGIVSVLKKDGTLAYVDYKTLKQGDFYGHIEGGATIISRFNKDDIDQKIAQATSNDLLRDHLREYPQIIAEEEKAQAERIKQREEESKRAAMKVVEDSEVDEEVAEVENSNDEG